MSDVWTEGDIVVYDYTQDSALTGDHWKGWFSVLQGASTSRSAKLQTLKPSAYWLLSNRNYMSVGCLRRISLVRRCSKQAWESLEKKYGRIAVETAAA